MESTIVILLAIVLIFWFKNAIKGFASTAETIALQTNETISDSIETYGIEVSILNAEKRAEQFARINKLEARVTTNELRNLLNNIEEEAETAIPEQTPAA